MTDSKANPIENVYAVYRLQRKFTEYRFCLISLCYYYFCRSHLVTEGMAASQTQTPEQIGMDSSSLDDIDVSNLEGVRENRRTNGECLTMDETFELLKNSRRRAVIRQLIERDGSAQLSDLAEHIAAAENGITVHELSSDQRKRVYIGLYQCHLPKMDNLGVIEYDKNRGTVELQESVTQLLPYLNTNPADSTERSPEPVVFSAITIAVIALIGTVGFGPLGAIPAILWAGLSAIGLVGVAFAHYSVLR